MLTILIAEDEQHNRAALEEMLTRMGHQVVVATDGRQALEKASQLSFDLVISDLRMPNLDGIGLLDSLITLGYIQDRYPCFAFMTAYGRMDEAVDAMRKGAIHFLSKPLRKKDLTMLIEEVLRARDIAAARSTRRKNTESGLTAPDLELVYRSRNFGEVVEMIDRVAPTTASVLILGESGTGKEMLARRLHEKSGRAQGPFVAVNSAAIPEHLLESELFGYERGAFTGAEQARVGKIRAADKGTFLIDEISSMPPATQAKLLRVLQDRKVMPLGATTPVDCDVRWVSAANEDPEELVKSGRFREDLMYRLKVVTIEIPPLRDRPEDIDPLVDHFAKTLSAERELKVPESTREKLRAHLWPGNVRELRNVLERAHALSPDGVFTETLLPEYLQATKRGAEIRFAVGTSLQAVQDRMIDETLRLCGGDKVQAAHILGINARTIYRWLERKTE